jgi:hypothetical protein
MPRIADEYLECAVYLYETQDGAVSGEGHGASGFLVSVRSEAHADLCYAYIVTCRHVVDKATFARLNTTHGKTEIVEIPSDCWELSESNDVAIAEIDLTKAKQTIFRFVPEASFITEEIINDLGIGMGDEVFLVGRLIDHSGKQRNTPSGRFGHIAMMPFEKVRNDFLDEDVAAFMCEVKSIGGFSGSPVFVHVPPFALRPGNKTLDVKAKGPFLLGVDWGHKSSRQVPVLDKNGDEASGLHIKRNSGIACIAPAWDVAAILNCEKFRLSRTKEDEDIRQKRANSSTVLDSETVSTNPPDVNQIAKSVIDRISET